MKAIFNREVNAYFNGIQGYICGAFMLLFIGIYTMSINLSQGYVNFEYVLQNMDFILIIIIPILTMRIIAEERRQKTDQLLYSLPLSMTKIVLGKYFAMLAVLALPTLIICMYPFILSMYGEVPLKVAYSAILAFFMLCAALASIGMFISSATENQGIAAGLCFICMLIIYFSSTLADFFSATAKTSLIALGIALVLGGVILNAFIKNGTISVIVTAIAEAAMCAVYWLKPTVFEGLFPNIMRQISVFDRFYTFTGGVFDVKALVYFVSVAAVFIFLTVQSMEKRRWS